MIKSYKNIPRKDFLAKFFDLWNVIQAPSNRLTDKETTLLIEFMSLDDKYEFFRFGTRGKKEVRKKLLETGWKISDQNMSQLLAGLEKKGVIVKDADGVREILPYFNKLINKSNKYFALNMSFEIID